MKNSGFVFLLGEEHELIREAARDFAESEIAPIAAECDESGEFPHDTIRAMGAMGLMGIEVPEKYGGAGADTLAYALALEEISKVDGAHGTIMSANNSLFCDPLVKFGTDAQKEKFLDSGGLRQNRRCVFAYRADVRFRCGNDADSRRTRWR